MRRLCICLMAMALVVLPAWADGPETGIVEGKVTDAQDDALPGVLITLTGDRGSKNAVSGEDGGFRFALLVPGSYLLQAVLDGFQGFESAVNVSAGAKQVIPVQADTRYFGRDHGHFGSADGRQVQRYCRFNRLR